VIKELCAFLVVEDLPSMCETLGSIPVHQEKKESN
jgi:hypothetical protein